MPHAATLTPDPSIPALERIRIISKPFTVLFTILMVVMAASCISFTAAALFYDGPHVRMSNELLTTGEGLIMVKPEITAELLASSVAFAEIPLSTRLVGIVSISLLQWGALAMIFFHCRDLFRLYEHGQVFARTNGRCIRRIGFWLIVWGFAPALGRQLTVLVGVPDGDWFRVSSMAGVVLGALLYVLARVMDLGREIEREKASFI